MGDFDKLYSDTLQLLQENQIDDVNLEEVLRNPNFVELLRSLYQCNEDPEKIYISCVSQGFRMCDLQKAICLLRSEIYDGTSSPYYYVDSNYDRQEIKAESLNIIGDTDKESEEYYLSVKLYSEESVNNGQLHWINFQSNLFSTSSILKEVVTFFRCNIDELNTVTIDEEIETNFVRDIVNKNINIDVIDLVNQKNEVIIYCSDIEKLGFLYYKVCDYVNNLSFYIMFENCLLRLRKHIEGFDNNFQEILIEKVISNDAILSVCKEFEINHIKDFLDKKPIKLSVEELNEVLYQINQINTVTPKEIFEKWINCLLPREHYVISKRYLEGALMTLESIGMICNVSRERIRQVERTAISSMLSSKRNKFRSLLISQLKLLSPHQSYITLSELERFNIKSNVAIFLDKITGDIIYDAEFQACFFSRASKYKLEQSLEELPDEFTMNDLQDYIWC